MKIKSFTEFCNEEKHKPLWNGTDYLDIYGNIKLSDMNLTELPCLFPKKWNKGFYCFGNKLTSLEGCPIEVMGSFNCENNELTSLEGAPKMVGGIFNCAYNKVKFTRKYVRQLCDVKGKIYIETKY